MAARKNNIMRYFEFFLVLVIVYYVSIQETKPKVTLVVGIFSAPQNFQQRDAIRKTWLKLAHDGSSRSKVGFVLGKSLCPLHPYDRLDNYGCDERRLYRFSEVLSSLPSLAKTDGKHSADGFGFVADYKIQVTHIGFHDCLQLNGTATIELKNGFDGKVLSKVSYSATDTGPKAITPIVFPRHSEGLLTVSVAGHPSSGNICPVIKKNTLGGITYVRFLKNGQFQPANEKTSICPFITYKILENNTYADMEQRKRSWYTTMQQTNEDINEEISKFHDVVLVNVTDVYKNLPKKLIRYVSYINSENNLDFDYLLKTDDDSFVDLRRVLAELSDPWIQTPGMWWWSKFRNYWRVPHEGKWREDHYQSATYPPFPCGGGYVINRATVNYLATNSEQLKLFQGEDVSIGIWLSALNIRKHVEVEPTDRAVSYKAIMQGMCEDRCAWTCNSKPQTAPRCNHVQVPVPDMYSTWRNYKATSFL